METLLGLWNWLEAQGLAGDVTQWVVGLLTGIPFAGGVIGAVIGIFKPSAAYKLGKKWGLWISTNARKIPVVGKFWELFEDRLLGGIALIFNGIKDGANEDDKK